MKQKYKKLGIIVAIVLIILVVLTFVANMIIERKIKTALDNLPESVELTYDHVNANVWSGTVELVLPTIMITGETTSKTILNAKLKTIKVIDLSYWDFIFNDKVSVETLEIDSLIAKYLHNPLVKNDDYNSGFLDQINQLINVEKISITNADVLVANYETDSTLLSIPKFNFELLELQIDPKVSKEKKAMTYGNFTFNAEHLKWATNIYDDLFADAIHITNSEAKIKGFKLKTKYNKAAFSALLETERDHFNLKINELKITDLDFGFNDNERFYFNSEKVIVNVPDAEIYRDKLVEDDLTYKPLYGKMLRDLNFNLGLKTVEIIEGNLSYLEKVKADEPAGRLDFTAMNATISNLGNTFGDEATEIEVRAKFMKTSPLNVHWNFKVADITDQFVFKADIGHLNATQMNQFTEPNLHVDLNGELKQTYFTVGGNPTTSRSDLKVKYEDFKISILRKDSKEKNKFLSSIVNLFVSKDSEDEKKTYRYGQSENIERDGTKSVFNFLWLNIRGGLLSAMTGDGKESK